MFWNLTFFLIFSKNIKQDVAYHHINMYLSLCCRNLYPTLAFFQKRPHTGAFYRHNCKPEFLQTLFYIPRRFHRISTWQESSSAKNVSTSAATYSAIRLTHIPTGIVVQCQDEKSQLKNYDKALNELRTRIYNMEYQKYLDNISAKRKTMVSTGDRSAKIRTYNYQQSRVTDHRINYTMYNLPVFMDGAIQDVIDQLIIAENAERLKEAGE